MRNRGPERSIRANEKRLSYEHPPNTPLGTEAIHPSQDTHAYPSTLEKPSNAVIYLHTKTRLSINPLGSGTNKIHPRQQTRLSGILEIPPRQRNTPTVRPGDTGNSFPPTRYVCASNPRMRPGDAVNTSPAGDQAHVSSIYIRALGPGAGATHLYS